MLYYINSAIRDLPVLRCATDLFVRTASLPPCTLTVFVVLKRIRTRFFEANQNREYRNPPPGVGRGDGRPPKGS